MVAAIVERRETCEVKIGSKLMWRPIQLHFGVIALLFSLKGSNECQLCSHPIPIQLRRDARVC